MGAQIEIHPSLPAPTAVVFRPSSLCGLQSLVYRVGGPRGA